MSKTQLQTNNDYLLSMIQELKGKAVGGGEDISAELATYGAHIEELGETIDSLPSAGGGGGGIEYEIITIPAWETSATYTLSRVTQAIGGAECGGVYDIGTMISLYNDTYYKVSDVYIEDTPEGEMREYHTEVGILRFSNGEIIWNNDTILAATFHIVLINDPTANAIST